MTNTPAIVFVYGTLKVGGFFAEHFDKYRIHSFKATVYGSLYSVQNQFPAIILDLDNGGIVHGEIHSYTNGEEVLALMDLIEGCEVPEDGGSPTNLFNRSLTIADFDDDNAEVPVIIYTWNQAMNYLEKIDSGIWEL